LISSEVMGVSPKLAVLKWMKDRTKAAAVVTCFKIFLLAINVIGLILFLWKKRLAAIRQPPTEKERVRIRNGTLDADRKLSKTCSNSQ
jgi:hypothetical protein